MRQPASDLQSGFRGGLNTTADPSELAHDEMRRAENVRLTAFGAVQKRLGSQRTHAAAIGAGAAVRGGFAWKRPTSVTELAVANGQLHTGTYAIPMTWTAQVGALDSTKYLRFAPFRDGSAECVYIADGGLLNKWDGTTLTVNIASTPSVAQIAVQNQRLFGITGTDQTLYYSALNNGDTLGTGATDSGSFVVRTFGNQELTGLLALGDSLIMFHREGVSRFTGYAADDVAIDTGTRGITSDVGTIAPNTIIAVENVGYFLSDRGVYRITEGGVETISTKIESVFSSLDQSQFNRAFAVHHRSYKEVWFYLPDVGCYVFNYRLGSWSGPMTGVFTTTTPGAFWETTDATSKPIVLFGGSDGFVRRVDATDKYKDDYLSDGTGGTAFSKIAQCRRMYCGTPEEEKAWRKIEVLATVGGSVTYSVQYSTATGSGSRVLPVQSGTVWGGAGTVWGTGTWGQGGSGSQEIQASGRGNYIDITIVDDGLAASSTSRVTVQGFSYGRRYATV